MLKGRIIKIISNDYTVLSNNVTYVCKSRGRFRQDEITPLVGDIVLFDEKEKYIKEIDSRLNKLERPKIVNIDQAIIICSVKEPNFSSHLLDKLLCVIEYNNIKPIIIFTKLDLLNKIELKDIDKYFLYYKTLGYEIYKNTELEAIPKIFKNKISVFTGQSGAGKSTLLNRLNSDLNLKTDIISKALGRGKHTTRHVELIPLYKGMVADTPGFSALSLATISKEGIRDGFPEFNNSKDKCQYRNCFHLEEKNCEIKRLVSEGLILESRYNNYVKFIKEV